MKYFAQSVFQHVRQQMQQTGDGSQSKLMFMMPCLPAEAVLGIANQLTTFCMDNTAYAMPIIKVAKPLVKDWNQLEDGKQREAADTIRDHGWVDEQEAMTLYRHQPTEVGPPAVVLLIGVDRVTDASSLEDFHHCDPPKFRVVL